MNNNQELLNKRILAIESNDKILASELSEVRKNGLIESNSILESLDLDGGLEKMNDEFALETIVLRTGRPVLTVFKGDTVLEFNEVESEVWRERLINSKQQLELAVQSVGRIELENHPTYDWVGTGWLVEENIVVTNRHVAEVFGRSNGNGFVFRQGIGGKLVKTSIDFLEEANNPDELTFSVEGILHIEDSDGPDMALLRVRPTNARQLPKHISLSNITPEINQQVVVIGYPAQDSRILEQSLMFKIFGDVYNKKRLAPGQLFGVSETELLHDCSTLGGNSGSVVLDLQTGFAVGLHFAGKFLQSNSAVPAALIKQRVDKLTNKSAAQLNKVGTSISAPKKEIKSQVQVPPTKYAAEKTSVNFTIPLEINIALGTPDFKNMIGQVSRMTDNDKPGNNNGGRGENFVEEALPEDYNDRIGYIPTFLGGTYFIPLPEINTNKWENEIVYFNVNGKKENVLKYQHFSLVMCKSRRLCFYSAVNIDGKSSVGMTRTGWKMDPRIPNDQQILKECYGSEPKFSRGHMTRREDPIWGEESEAIQGNSDSMHVTNTVPQMQRLNAGIWLGLENYALHNARKDEMRISVFTGPVLRHDDKPTEHSEGINIPKSFWKIIAFIHDETKKLCATGYTISQEEFLKEEEIVFGEYKTFQVSIASIERATGLSFGELKNVDALNIESEMPEMDIRDFAQIKFI